MHRLALILACLSLLASAAHALDLGEKAADFTFTDIRYLPRTLDDLPPAQAYVIVFTSTTCPLARRYTPQLNELYAAYQERGVQFLSVNASPEDSVADEAQRAIEFEIRFPVTKDFTGEVAAALGATRTPEAIVLDRERRLRYRGRIDDQYRLSGVQPAPSRHDLRLALDDLLAGREVAVPLTVSEGCSITPFTLPEPERALTYAEDIAPIVNKHCVECHRPGTATPFALLNYEQVASKATMIAEVVQQERMPPWFGAREFGPFQNERGLSEAEKRTIQQWAKYGKAPGDLAKAPAPPEFPEAKWRIPEPDLVLTAEKDFELPATGYIEYQYVTLPYVFPEDTWIQGIDIRPSNPEVVHHANLVYTIDGSYEQDSNFLTGIVPGGSPMLLRDGFGLKIAKGAVCTLQIHYVTTGKPETDRIAIGFRYAKENIRKQVQYRILSAHDFQIPPGDPALKVTQSREIPQDAVLVALFSHMHLRGKDATFIAHYPGGADETLLMIPNYSFDWQIPYVFPLGKKELPAGTIIEKIGHFDNSAFNPFNPDPTVTVQYGPQSHNEMMDGYVFYVLKDEQLDLQVDPATGLALPQTAARP